MIKQISHLFMVERTTFFMYSNTTMLRCKKTRDCHGFLQNMDSNLKWYHCNSANCYTPFTHCVIQTNDQWLATRVMFNARVCLKSSYLNTLLGISILFQLNENNYYWTSFRNRMFNLPPSFVLVIKTVQL